MQGRGRVGRLMWENGIKIVRTREFRATTDSNHAFNIAPNLLDQDFPADGPNQKWAGDISFIWTSEGWLYLAVILDLYSRRVIGWPPSHRYCVSTAGQRYSNRMKRELATRAGYGARPLSPDQWRTRSHHCDSRLRAAFATRQATTK